MQVNKRLVNILLLLLIIVVGIYLIPPVLNVVRIIFIALSPLLIAFLLAFILNPLISKLEKRGINRSVAIIVIYSLIVVGVAFLIFGVLKPAVDRLGDISLGIENIFNQIGELLNLDTTEIKMYVVNMIGELVNSINNFFTASGGSVGEVWEFFVGFIIVFIVGSIFLYNFENYKGRLKNFLTSKNKEKTYDLINNIDTELTNYLVAELLIAVIQFIEYTTLILILSIFNPVLLNYAVLVGIVAAILSLIPYLGGYFSIIFTGIILMSIPNPAYPILGLLIFMIIFPQLDAYVINPKIYNKKLNINPIITIGIILVSSSLFGIAGAILSIPFYVIFAIVYSSYKTSIKKGIIKFRDSI